MDVLSLRYALLSYGLSGILLGISFIYPVLWILGLFGAALFFWCVKNTQNLKTALIGGGLAWCVKSLLAVSLFWSVYPINWLEISFGNAEVFIVGVYWFTVAFFLSFGGVAVAGAGYLLLRALPVKAGFVWFPILWVLGEIMSALSFSLWTFGPGATVNSVYSLGYLGYIFGQHEIFLSLASIAGVYGLSALGALLGYGLWYLYSTMPRQRAGILMLVFVLLLWGTRGEVGVEKASEENTNETTVAIIDTRFGDDWLKIENREEHKRTQVAEAVAAALLLEPDYILLPEDSRFTNTDLGIDRSYNFFRFNNSDPETVVIDSGRTALPGGVFTQRAYIYDGQSKRGWITDKQYLVPQGEFMPYFYSASLRVIGLGAMSNTLERRFTYVPGPEKSQAELPSIVPGILFCFESADPRASLRLIKERNVPFIVHPISHAWFHESEILWQQQDVMLKMQALWSGVPIVSAANMAQGALYTQAGKKVEPILKASGESWQVSLVSW